MREVFSRARAVEHLGSAQWRSTMDHNKGEEMKGRAKEAAGDLTGNDEMKREGKTDRASAKAKDKAQDAVDKVRDKVKDVLDR
jgi:uncharacterized protein YjbJ (UPF0337 family)